MKYSVILYSLAAIVAIAFSACSCDENEEDKYCCSTIPADQVIWKGLDHSQTFTFENEVGDQKFFHAAAIENMTEIEPVYCKTQPIGGCYCETDGAFCSETYTVQSQNMDTSSTNLQWVIQNSMRNTWDPDVTTHNLLVQIKGYENTLPVPLTPGHPSVSLEETITLGGTNYSNIYKIYLNAKATPPTFDTGFVYLSINEGVLGFVDWDTGDLYTRVQ